MHKESDESKKPSFYRRRVSEKPSIYALKNSKQRQNPAVMEGDRTETETQIYGRKANRDRKPTFTIGERIETETQYFVEGEQTET